MRLRFTPFVIPLIVMLFAPMLVTAQSVGGDYLTAPQDMVESTGVTDLMWVAGNHSVEDLERLISDKSDLDPAAMDFYGNTALHYVAFYASDPEVIDLLLEVGVPVDVVNSQGFTAFEIMQGNEDLRSTDPYMNLLKAKLDAGQDE